MNLSHSDVNTLTLTLVVSFVLGYLTNGIKNWYLKTLKMQKGQGTITADDLKTMSKRLNSSTQTSHQLFKTPSSNTMQNSKKESGLKRSQQLVTSKSCSGKPKEQRSKRSSQYLMHKTSTPTEKPSGMSSVDLSTNGK